MDDGNRPRSPAPRASTRPTSGVSSKRGFPEMGNLCAIRARKMRKQKGRCWYCDTPMWSRNPDEFRKRYNLQRRTVYRYQCTAEHLIARQDGGGNGADNIVAACRHCNQTRHNSKRVQTAEKYRIRVRRRVATGTWETMQTRKAMGWVRTTPKRKKQRKRKIKWWQKVKQRQQSTEPA